MLEPEPSSQACVLLREVDHPVLLSADAAHGRK